MRLLFTVVIDRCHEEFACHHCIHSFEMESAMICIEWEPVNGCARPQTMLFCVSWSEMWKFNGWIYGGGGFAVIDVFDSMVALFLLGGLLFLWLSWAFCLAIILFNHKHASRRRVVLMALFLIIFTWWTVSKESLSRNRGHDISRWHTSAKSDHLSGSLLGMQ